MRNIRIASCLALVIAGCSTSEFTLPADESAPESPIKSTTKSGSSNEPLVFPTGPSESELLQMQKYLDERNDPRIIVESIHVGEGEDIDCIKTELQHGYGRPITSFSTPPPDADVAKSSNDRPTGEYRASQDYGTKTKICPNGTVPRRRTTIQELSRFKSLDDFFAKMPGRFGDQSSHAAGELPLLAQGPTSEHQYGVARQDVTNSGTEAFLNLWSPSTELTSEFSLSQLWDQRGSGANLETVEAGWQVFSDKYSDANARLFIYFTPDNYKPVSQGGQGCYNLDCTGFVQVNNTYTLGGTVGPISVSGGSQYAMPYRIQMNSSGDWWVQYNYVWLGYWPNSLFDSNGIANEAATVTYGGEIVDLRNLNLHTATQMGSGAFASAGWTFAAYQRQLHYYFGSRATPSLGDVSPYLIQDDSSCYSITTALSSDVSWGRKIYFGGQGYDPIRCW